jgi:hypothetical protein
MGVELLASPSVGATCFVLCASMPSRMSSTCAQICIERGLGGTVTVTPITVEVWMSSWRNDRGHVWIRARFPCSYSLCTVMSVPSAGMGTVVRAPVAPRLARGLHVFLERGRSMPRGSGSLVLTLQGGQGENCSRQGAGVGRFDDVMGGRARQKTSLSLRRFCS